MDYNKYDIDFMGESESLAPLNYNELKTGHLLIGGSSGSGKSTVIHKLIANILQDRLDKSLLILCDPKRVELARYRKDAHVIKYGNDLDSIDRTLSYAVGFMDYRYKQMERRGLTEWDGSTVFVVVDEVADLLLTDKKLFTSPLQKLLQLGRASKMYVILATQSPSRATLPAFIQCNLVNRLGLYCSSSIESRQVVGVSGCELLDFHGYGLLKTPHELTKVRIEL